MSLSIYLSIYMPVAKAHPDQDSEIALFGKRIINVKEWAEISTFVF